MKNWLQFIKERFPIVGYLLMVFGLSLSGWALSGTVFSPQVLTINSIGLLLFFFVLRIMDEYKDYSKDIVAHPQRPLPRGLLKAEQVKKAINSLSLLMLVFAIANYFLIDQITGLNYALLTVYLWLMYKEFYIGEKLNRFPLLYALSHQLILIPLCSYCLVSYASELYNSQTNYAFGFMIMGAFFTYEICRKLKPDAHKVLQTYRTVYGLKGCLILTLLTASLAIFFAKFFSLQILSISALALTWLSLFVLNLGKGSYKIVEGLATLSLLIHMWMLFVRNYLL